jgi:hypothetical protein
MKHNFEKRVYPFSLITLITVIGLLSSCNQANESNDKAKTLIVKENELLKKENELLKKEKEIIQREQKLDEKNRILEKASNIENQASSNNTNESETIAPALTPEQLEKYYTGGKKDPNVQLIRKKLNEYQSGLLREDEQISESVIDSLNSYDREYFRSKFFLATIEDGKYGGKWIQFIFINKPDRAFFVWIHNNKIESFGDAHWNKQAMKMVQNDRQALDGRYGF